MRPLMRLGSLALAAFLAAGTVTADAGETGDVVTASDVTTAIAKQIVPALKATFPSLSVGAAACPDYMDLSDERQAMCTLAVDDAQLPIAVTAGPDGTYPFTIRAAARLVVGSQLDALVAHDVLEAYGVSTQADCGSALVHVMAAGATLRCRVQGPGLRTVLTITMQDDGDVFVPRLPDRMSILERELETYEALHRDGKPTRVPGPVLAAMIRQVVDDVVRGTRDMPHVDAAVQCPALGDVSGSRHVACDVLVATLHLSYDIWMAGATMHYQSDRDWDFSPHIAAVAADYYHAKFAAAGFAESVAVDCGPPRWVTLDVGDALTCTLLPQHDTKKPLAIRIDPASGRMLYSVPSR